MKNILILCDLLNWRSHYIVDALALRWTQAGHKVTKRFSTVHLPDADIVFLHIDRTVVPERYARCLKNYPVVINRHAVNISKSFFSNNLLSPNDPYNGRVIIKTDANCGGIPDAVRFGYLWSLCARKFHWRSVSALNTNAYPVFEHLNEVPEAIWHNPRLIVEKFIPEKSDDLYYLRYWIFLGKKGWAGRFASRDPIVKFGKMIAPEETADIPGELRTWREKLGFDYGRFDYVQHQGKVILYDVNKTMGAGHHMEAYRTRLDYLADGINDFI